MRFVLTGLLLLVGCSDDNLGGVGAECTSSGDCAQGLLCDFGKKPHSCQPDGTVRRPDMTLVDLSGADFGEEDSGVGDMGGAHD